MESFARGDPVRIALFRLIPAFLVTCVVWLPVGCGGPTTPAGTQRPPRVSGSAPEETAHGKRGQPALEVESVQLHQPDPILRERLGNDVQPLTDYIKLLETAADEYWAKAPQPMASGLLITVGV